MTQDDPRIISLPTQQKKPQRQLTRGMEHMRSYVTIDEGESTSIPDNLLGEDAYGVPAAYAPLRTTRSDSSEKFQKRSDPFQFGTRQLEEGDDIFAHNAWDHVQVDSQYDEFITQQTEFQRQNQVSDFDKKRYNEKPEKWWDKFYGNNNANFFKDRKWLAQEFPILAKVTEENYGPVSVLEVGAGAGNTAFPVLAMNKNRQLKLNACDYSKKAINVIRNQKAYIEQENKVLQADVWDAAGEVLPPGIAAGSVDVLIMIFIFSALSPNQWQQALRNILTLLKPGGEVLFRDYGRGDLAQVRFKKDRYLEENFYVRGDGTRVYFFDETELRDIFTGKILATPESGEITPALEIVEFGVDRRMLVNRQRKLKMYRCWMQGRFRKPVESD